MLPKFIVLNTSCDVKEKGSLSFRQRKLLNRLDIELSSKNPYVRCSLNCSDGRYSFFFSNGVITVENSYKTQEELFERLKSFKEAMAYLECDLSETTFLQKEMMDMEKDEAEKRERKARRYSRY